VSDPREAIGAASLLLHCAEAEPFGVALIEALASGRPVVAPAGAGPLDIVTPECGALYEPCDAGAAAKALLETLDRIDRGEPLAAAARARAEDAFDLRDARARWAAVAGTELRAGGG
jgi:glycosyltransferase involved in cell wall biosynthesis